MDRLKAMQVFERVVNANSFSSAADSLHMSRPKVTKMIQEFEDFLRVRLLQRTTRRINLTAEGAAYYESCVRILADVAQTETALATERGEPRGKLRVETPGPMGRLVLVPAIADFHARFPQIELTVGTGDRQVDLVQEGIDCVIQVGTMRDSSLIAKRIGVLQADAFAGYTYAVGFRKLHAWRPRVESCTICRLSGPRRSPAKHLGC